MRKRVPQASDRQGIVGLQLLLSPYIAAGLPAAGAVAIAIYGRFGYELKWLYNAYFSKFIFKIAKMMFYHHMYPINKTSAAILFFFRTV